MSMTAFLVGLLLCIVVYLIGMWVGYSIGYDEGLEMSLYGYTPPRSSGGGEPMHASKFVPEVEPTVEERVLH